MGKKIDFEEEVVTEVDGQPVRYTLHFESINYNKDLMGTVKYSGLSEAMGSTFNIKEHGRANCEQALRALSGSIFRGLYDRAKERDGVE